MLKNEGKVKSIFLDCHLGTKKNSIELLTRGTICHKKYCTVAMRFFDTPIQFLIIYFPGGSTMMDSVSSTCLQKIPYLLEPQLIKKQGGI